MEHPGRVELYNELLQKIISVADLEFSVVNYNNQKYDFLDLDYSFVLEITEIIDQTTAFNMSSRRNLVDTL